MLHHRYPSTGQLGFEGLFFKVIKSELGKAVVGLCERDPQERLHAHGVSVCGRRWRTPSFDLSKQIALPTLCAIVFNQIVYVNEVGTRVQGETLGDADACVALPV